MVKPTTLKAATLLVATMGYAAAQNPAQGVGQASDAPPPSAEQAKLLEQQVRARLADITGGVLPLPDGIVQFTPDEHGYRITIPIGTLPQVEPKDAVITARAHQLDATRWSIDSEDLPPALKVTTQQQVPDAPAPAPVLPKQPPGVKGPVTVKPLTTHLVTLTYEVQFGQRTASGVFDPSYSTASTTQSTLASIDLVQTGGPAATIQHFGPVTSVSSITPSGDHRVDTLLDTSIQTYETKTAFPDGGPSLTLTMQRLHLISAMSGVATDKLVPLIRQLVEVSRAGGGASARAASDPAAKARQREHLHALLTAAVGLLTGAKLDETMEGLVFDANGHTGTVGHAAISFAGDAPQDILTGSMGLTVDGLTIADLPPTLTAYVPSHFVIHPTMSNISLSALTKLGLDASGADGRVPEADYAAMFQNGGINVGFDSLGLDVAGAAFTGTGNFNMTGPQAVTGQAEISARGLDALITQAQADPVLRSAAPVLIFLKGIATTTPEQSVWQISVSGGRVLVNGVDLMAMFGAMGR